MAPPRTLPLLAALLLLPACAGTAPPPREPPADDAGAAKPVEAAATPPTPAPAAGPAAAPAAAPAPKEAPAEAPKPPPGFAPPAALDGGDRWFVAVRPREGGEASVTAERHRRTRGEGLLREEVTWGASFAAVAGARHGTAQVFGLFLGEKGLDVSLLDGNGKPTGERRLEVASPYRVGTSWTVEGAMGAVTGSIEALEEVETPGGPVRALRVVHRTAQGVGAAMTTWYDAGLRPVRSEVRTGGPRGMLVEARAALASADPTPGEARAALEWAAKNLGR